MTPRVDPVLRTFAVTWDYRCPFARIAHDHLVTALEADAPWEVEFVPFSLKQLHVEDEQPDVWDAPDTDSGLLALQVGTAVRDLHPEGFLSVHRALFDARHLHDLDLRDEAVLRTVLVDHGIDADEVFAELASGRVLETIRKAHELAVIEHDVWGVPTFIMGERAVFVRLMEAAGDDAGLATATIERILDLLTGWPQLNEFKHTTRDR